MTTVNQAWPPVAALGTDSYNPQVVLIGCDHETQSYAMPSNKAVQQYELVKLVGSAVVQLTAAPVAGDVVGITAYAADNLTATAAAARTAAVHVYIDGEFNETKIILPSGVTADDVRAICRQSDIKLTNPLVRN